jgi:hypothetical protein
MNGNSLTPRPSKYPRNRALPGYRGILLGVILLVALLCFESFNFSTTQVALMDLLGGLTFAGVSWATILAIAFCGIDFAGIARLFIPEEQASEVSKDTWYLFGAWLLAATMNALLTWWGVSLGLVNRSLQSTAILSQEKLLDVVPVFIALLVWFTRILLIGSFSIAGPRLFSTAQTGDNINSMARAPRSPSVEHPAPVPPRPSPLPSMARPRPKPQQRPGRPEPEYVPDPSYAALEPAAHSLSGNPRGEQPARSNASF